jgi:hypothetical protein
MRRRNRSRNRLHIPARGSHTLRTHCRLPCPHSRLGWYAALTARQLGQREGGPR